MASSPAPGKQDIPHELWIVASTLTQEAQDAALKKCRELAFDTDRGHIPLEETLINLSDARDVVLDAVKKNKIKELPLKIQYSLLDQFRKVGEQIVAITNGTDAVLALEATTEDLTVSIWTYRLHNLSGEVLGFHNKMNQLKAQETLIRQAAREADKFAESREFAAKLREQIKAAAETIAADRADVQNIVTKVGELYQQSTETQQKVTAVAAQVQQHELTAAQQLANATQAAANTQALEKSAKETTADLSKLRADFDQLQQSAKELVVATDTSTKSHVEQFKTELKSLKDNTSTATTELTVKTDKFVTDVQAQVSEFVQETTGRLSQAETKHQANLDEQLKDFGTKQQSALSVLAETANSAIKQFTAEKDTVFEQNAVEFEKLVKNLNELEGRIRESIERATGYGLFHSFQKRQLDLANAKRFWAYALAAMVGVSLVASGLFIWSLQYVQVYNAAFYLKLSISIPLIYGIAFCNVQYSRERRLEEEYAFKSNISISLDPYQRLVAQIVDKGNAAELAKHTAFVIDSVNKVFTSPTESIFGDRENVNSIEKLLKSIGDFIEPLLKASPLNKK